MRFNGDPLQDNREEEKIEKQNMQEKHIAVFVDYDNIEIGVKSTLRRDFRVAVVFDALKEREIGRAHV